MTIETDSVDTDAVGPAPVAPASRPVRVCKYDTLTPGRGVAVLMPDRSQAAVFRTLDGRLFAVGNLDPATGAYVISRGLTGSRAGAATVASPMLKHIYDLATGRCVDGPAGPEPFTLPTFSVYCDEGVVYLRSAPGTDAPTAAGGTP